MYTYMLVGKAVFFTSLHVTVPIVQVITDLVTIFKTKLASC